MLVPILNLLFPLLFLAGIGSLLTGIITYAVALNKKSTPLKKKALTIIIVGAIIMLASLITVNIFKSRFH